ncbi:MAG: ribonuclease HII [Fimbriimonadaceae bacterium]|nr:ribonuclease HII [Fimbriimonadaceae bacterium]
MSRAVLPFDPRWVGIDEAGRGPIAGPVVVAAVRLPAGFDARGIVDSKQLSPAARDRAYDRIRAEADGSIVSVEPEEIDRLNILQATLVGMVRAAKAMATRAELAGFRIDGNQIPAGLPAPAEAWVKGDGRDASIAAASILAKVTRDRRMSEFARVYPEYGFERHFGYPTPEHLAALRTHGPCPIHRRSYAPVQAELSHLPFGD